LAGISKELVHGKLGVPLGALTGAYKPDVSSQLPDELLQVPLVPVSTHKYGISKPEMVPSLDEFGLKGKMKPKLEKTTDDLTSLKGLIRGLPQKEITPAHPAWTKQETVASTAWTEEDDGCDSGISPEDLAKLVALSVALEKQEKANTKSSDRTEDGEKFRADDLSRLLTLASIQQPETAPNKWFPQQNLNYERGGNSIPSENQQSEGKVKIEDFAKFLELLGNLPQQQDSEETISSPFPCDPEEDIKYKECGPANWMMQEEMKGGKNKPEDLAQFLSLIGQQKQPEGKKTNTWDPEENMKYRECGPANWMMQEEMKGGKNKPEDLAQFLSLIGQQPEMGTDNWGTDQNKEWISANPDKRVSQEANLIQETNWTPRGTYGTEKAKERGTKKKHQNIPHWLPEDLQKLVREGKLAIIETSPAVDDQQEMSAWSPRDEVIGKEGKIKVEYPQRWNQKGKGKGKGYEGIGKEGKINVEHPQQRWSQKEGKIKKNFPYEKKKKSKSEEEKSRQPKWQETKQQHPFQPQQGNQHPFQQQQSETKQHPFQSQHPAKQQNPSQKNGSHQDHFQERHNNNWKHEHPPSQQNDSLQHYLQERCENWKQRQEQNETKHPFQHPSQQNQETNQQSFERRDNWIPKDLQNKKKSDWKPEMTKQEATESGEKPFEEKQRVNEKQNVDEQNIEEWKREETQKDTKLKDDKGNKENPEMNKEERNEENIHKGMFPSDQPVYEIPPSPQYGRLKELERKRKEEEVKKKEEEGKKKEEEVKKKEEEGKKKLQDLKKKTEEKQKGTPKEKKEYKSSTHKEEKKNDDNQTEVKGFPSSFESKEVYKKLEEIIPSQKKDEEIKGKNEEIDKKNSSYKSDERGINETERRIKERSN